jgi:general stress protein YciG
MGEDPKVKRGFAAMSPERQREIARMGGKSVSPSSRAFSNPELAKEAGKKGGKAVPAEKRSFSKDHDLASRAARKRPHSN